MEIYEKYFEDLKRNIRKDFHKRKPDDKTLHTLCYFAELICIEKKQVVWIDGYDSYVLSPIYPPTKASYNLAKKYVIESKIEPYFLDKFRNYIIGYFFQDSYATIKYEWERNKYGYLETTYARITFDNFEKDDNIDFVFCKDKI